MMRTMKRKLMTAALAAAMLAVPAAALARDEEKEHEVYDARLEGYKENVTLEGGSVGLTWVLLIVLGAIGMAGLFKDAKRTHLD